MVSLKNYVIVEEELQCTDIDDTGNLVDLPRLLFIDEECGIKVDYTKLEPIMFVKFICLVLMIKDAYQMMALIAWLIFTEI